MDRRSNLGLRRRLENLRHMVRYGVYSTFTAAFVMRDEGVPMDVALRVLGRR